MKLPPGQTMGRRAGDGGELHHDQHGVHRHFTDLEEGSGPEQRQRQRPHLGQELGQGHGQENLLLPPGQRNNNNNGNNNHLRGNPPFKEEGNHSSADGEEEEAVPITVVFNPRSFSIEGTGR